MQIGETTVEAGKFQSRRERVKPESANYANLYVRNFPAEWDGNKVTDVFGEFGNVTSAVIQEDLKDKKYAFVNFDSSENAKKQTTHCTKRICAQTMRSRRRRKRANRRTRIRAHAGRRRRAHRRYGASRASSPCGTNNWTKVHPVARKPVPKEDTTDESLTEMFSPFGTITSAKVMSDESFGFVNFSTPEEATKAVTEMHWKVIQGKLVYVGLAEKKKVCQDRLQQRCSPRVGHLEGLQGQGMMGSIMEGHIPVL